MFVPGILGLFGADETAEDLNYWLGDGSLMERRKQREREQAAREFVQDATSPGMPPAATPGFNGDLTTIYAENGAPMTPVPSNPWSEAVNAPQVEMFSGNPDLLLKSVKHFSDREGEALRRYAEADPEGALEVARGRMFAQQEKPKWQLTEGSDGLKYWVAPGQDPVRAVPGAQSSDKPVFGGGGLEASTLNFLIDTSDRLKNGEEVTPRVMQAYNLARQRASRPSRHTDEMGRIVTTPGLDLSGLYDPEGPPASPSRTVAEDAPREAPEGETVFGLLDSAVGPQAWALDAASRIPGVQPNERVTRGRNLMMQAKERFLAANKGSSRASLQEQERILSAYPSDGIFETPERARIVFTQMAELTRRELSEDMRLMNDPSASPNERKLAENRANEKRRFLTLLGEPKEYGASNLTKPKAQQPQYREGQTATNPNTGERIIYRNGQWGPMT